MKTNSVRFWFVVVLVVALGVVLFSNVVSSQETESATTESDLHAAALAPTAPSSLLFSYQGQLLDANGDPITDSAVDMIFKLYDVAELGTACWSEDHTGADAVDVQDGLFNVLLGQITAIDTACLTGDVYLELVVGSETLSPRELLTSVVYAVEASTLPDGATTQGSLGIGGQLDLQANDIVNVDDISSGDQAGGNANLMITNSSGNIRLRATQSLLFFIDTDNDSADAYFRVWKNADSIGGAAEELFEVDEAGDAHVAGNMYLNPAGGSDSRIQFSNDDSIQFDDVNSNPNGNSYIFSADSAPGTGNANLVAGAMSLSGYLSADGIQTPFKIKTERSWEFKQYGSGSTTDTALHSLTDSKSFQFTNEDDSVILDIRAKNSTGGYLDMVDNNIVNVGYLETNGNLEIKGNNLYLGGSTNESVALRQDGDQTHLFIAPYGGQGTGDVFKKVVIGGGGGDVNLSVSGDVTCGALIESNLQTDQEKADERIDRFEEGDLLCWSPETDQLELCATAGNRLVMAVADPNGKPIVMGAEPTKVLGPILAGDILVSSNVPGYAMVNNDPKPGTVIAQALEDFDGEQGVIKAMIRKW